MIWASLEGELVDNNNNDAAERASDLMSEDEDEDIKVYEQPPAPERRLSPRENRRRPDFFQSPM